MNNSTASCAAFICDSLSNPKPLGVFLLVLSVACLGICGFNWYIISAEKLVEAFPIFHLILSQQVADMCNIAYYVIAGIFLITEYRFDAENMLFGILVGYWEAYMYGCQLLHHVSVALVRAMLTFADKCGCCSLGVRQGVKSTKFIFASIALTWAANLVLTIFLHVRMHSELYYDVDYGYLSFATPDLVPLAEYELYWAIMERGCVGISVVLYLAIFVQVSLQRRQNGSTTNQKEAKKKAKQWNQELNILIVCAVNVAICAVNTMTWRMIGYLFNITDTVNSVASAALSLFMVKRVRNHWMRMFKDNAGVSHTSTTWAAPRQIIQVQPKEKY